MLTTTFSFANKRPLQHMSALCVLVATSLITVWGCQSDGDSGSAPPKDTADPDLEVAEIQQPETRDDSNSDGGSDVATDSETDADTETREKTFSNTRIPGLSAPATVRFDEWGVPHVTCQTDADCFAVQGYIHAQHRYFALDMIRRQALGKLSHMLGSLGLDQDTKWRKLMSNRKGKKLEDLYYQRADEQTRDMFDAYTRGINAWLDDLQAGENGARLPKEYDIPFIRKSNLLEWKPKHSVALYLMLARLLNKRASLDLYRGEVFSQLDAKVATDLFTPRVPENTDVLGASGAEPLSLGLDSSEDSRTRNPLERLKARKKRLEPAMPVLRRARQTLQMDPVYPFSGKSGGASNAWTVGNDHSKDAKALLASDPHLDLLNPPIWHMIELDSKSRGDGSLHVTGASFPAAPGIIFGQNEQVAWGATNARLDQTDFYVEKLTEDGDAVMHEGDRVELLEKTFTFEVAGQSNVEKTFEYVPHHGPLVSKDVENRRAVSFRWAAQQPGDDLNYILKLMKAETVQDAVDATDRVNAVPLSFHFIDTEGNQAWRVAGKLPNRPWASPDSPPWLPLEADGSAEWDGFTEPASLPELTNPPAGFIATTNNDFDGSYEDADATNDGHTPWQSPPMIGYRHIRITEMIESRSPLNAEDMTKMQADVTSVHARRLLPPVLSAIESQSGELSSEQKSVFEALKQWEYTCPSGLKGHDAAESEPVDDAEIRDESAGCSAFAVFLPKLTQAVFGDELSAILEDQGMPQFDSTAWYTIQMALLDAFKEPSQLAHSGSYFDDTSTEDATESKKDILNQVLEETSSKLQDLFESSARSDWIWGRIHVATLASPFASQGLDTYNHGPFANSGGFITVNFTAPERDSERFPHRRGVSLRTVYRAKDGQIEGWFELPGGQSHHRDSKHYMDLVEDWLNHDPHPMYFGPSETTENAVRTITVRSESEQ